MSIRYVQYSGGSRISHRGRQPQRRGREPIILTNFHQKLHKNEKFGLGMCSPNAPLDPPMQ